MKQKIKKVKSAGILLHCCGKYLLGLASGSKKWGIPKGKIDGDEGERAAAFREFYEETGFKLEGSSVTVDEEPFIRYSAMVGRNLEKEFVIFKGNCDDPALLTTELKCITFQEDGKPELEGFAWVPLEEGLRIASLSQKPIFNEVLKQSGHITDDSKTV